MPKRSNWFQKLIYLIQLQFSEGSTVTESKLLTDHQTGSQVEVDIVIDAVADGIPLVISVECTARARPATVEWVREMWAKHQFLPTDKLVLVSRSGFTLEAEEKAKALGADAITLEEAKEFDWAETIKGLKDRTALTFARFDMKPHKWTLRFSQQTLPEGFTANQPDIEVDSAIIDPSGETQGTIKQHFVAMVQDRSVGERIMRRWIRQRKDEFTLTWKVAEGTTIEDRNGNRFLIDALVIEGKCFVKSTPIGFKRATYRDAQVMYGNAPNIFDDMGGDPGQLTVAFVEQQGKTAKGILALPPDSLSGECVFTALNPICKDDNENDEGGG